VNGQPVSATILSRETLSADILGLTLRVPSGSLVFQPGQWVDFQVPGLEEVGGFSMTSTPSRLQDDHCLTLAVKKSRSKVTQWLHETARDGDSVTIRAGGECVYSADDMPGPLLLVAGGIGITPLISIFRHVRETEPQKELTLLFSAKQRQDLIFREEIEAEAAANENVAAVFAATGEDGSDHRFNGESIAAAMSRPLETHVFLCGPSSMLAELPAQVHRAGVPADQIHFESWW
jgi:ferredoxin-NADP reductase